MKKISLIGIMLLLYTLVSASSINDIKSQLIGMITSELLHKKDIKVYAIDSNYQELEGASFHFRLINSCNEADLIITPSMEDIPPFCKNDKTLILMTKYQEYKKSTLPIGALFWQKGRPNLIFSARRLQELSIKAPSSFERYIE